MPFHKRTYQHGNLIIQFKIKFPSQVDTKSISLLQDALGDASAKSKGKGGKKEEQKDEGAEVCYLKQFQEEHRNTHH